jgi:hypothetical protein
MICFPHLLRYFLTGLRAHGLTAIIRLLVWVALLIAPRKLPDARLRFRQINPTTRLFEANFPND